MAATAAKVLAATVPGSMAVRAYLQLSSLKKAPLEVTTGFFLFFTRGQYKG